MRRTLLDSLKVEVPQGGGATVPSCLTGGFSKHSEIRFCSAKSALVNGESYRGKCDSPQEPTKSLVGPLPLWIVLKWATVQTTRGFLHFSCSHVYSCCFALQKSSCTPGHTHSDLFSCPSSLACSCALLASSTRVYWPTLLVHTAERSPVGPAGPALDAPKSRLGGGGGFSRLRLLTRMDLGVPSGSGGQRATSLPFLSGASSWETE